MKNTGKWVLPVLGVAIVATAIVVVRRSSVQHETPDGGAAAADPTGKVAFRMEQQWQIHLKLAKGEAATVAPQIASTGRIVPAPRNQAIVAPPVGGVLGAERLPVVGQQVARGQVLAILTETLSAADVAQYQRDLSQFQLQAAQYQLQAEQFQLEKEQLQLGNAQLQLGNAQLQLDADQLQLDSDRLQIENEQFQLGNDQLQIGAAQLRLENARIEAERRRLVETLNAAQIRRNLAKTEFDRATRLFEKKAYSQKQVQEAEAAYKTEEAGIAALTAQLNVLTPLSLPVAPAARAPRTAPAPPIRANPPALAAPAVRANRTVPVPPDPPGRPNTVQQVRAPIAGTLVKVHKAAGEQVQAGEAMFEIVNLDTVWVEAPIFEKDLARLKSGDRALFTTAAFPTAEFIGKLIDIGAVIDDRTRAASAYFEVPNLAKQLRIGMQANVRMDSQESVKAVMVPKEAVLDNESKKIVYVLVSGEEFQRVEVQLGDEYGGKVAVLSGLQPGQRVVTQGAYQLKLQELRPANAGAHTHEV